MLPLDVIFTQFHWPSMFTTYIPPIVLHFAFHLLVANHRAPTTLWTWQCCIPVNFRISYQLCIETCHKTRKLVLNFQVNCCPGWNEVYCVKKTGPTVLKSTINKQKWSLYKHRKYKYIYSLRYELICIIYTWKWHLVMYVWEDPETNVWLTAESFRITMLSTS